MRGKTAAIAALGALVLGLATSCASVKQDMMISTAQGEEVLVVRELAHQLARIDGLSIGGQPVGAEAKRLMERLQSALADGSLPNGARAQATAFRGILELLSGDRRAAQESYLQAQALHKGDVYIAILGSRLGSIGSLEQVAVSKGQRPLLLLEMAIANYKAENYLAAVAQFDEAFISLEEPYHEAYSQLREAAWRLRDISSSTGADHRELLKRDSITLLQMIALAQERGDLLYKYTGSKKLPPEQLLQQLKAQGLLYSVNSWTDVGTLSKNTLLTRALAARFLWNLYNDRRGTLGNAPKYSHQFVGLGSPIQDVPLDSPDFDAILGCVEQELLALPDGINFFPEEPLSGVDFNASLQKIR